MSNQKNSKNYSEDNLSSTNKNELISIIVPIYNRQDKAYRCYKSIINQTYQNLEIIFVDDGSNDNTKEVLKTVTDPRFKAIYQTNAGPFEARRNGFENSTGQYVCFIDSDDAISKDFIEKLYYTIKKTNTKLCISRLGLHIDYPIIKRILFKNIHLPSKINFSENPKYLPAMQPSIVGRLFVIDSLELKKIDFRANEDLAIMYSLYAKINEVSISNSAIYHVYYSGNSQRNLLFGYKFENIYNTFGTLSLVKEEYQKLKLDQKYYQELEMLFIKNIFERINNMSSCIKNKSFLYQFLNLLLDYLEAYFPNWHQNIYYQKNFPLGEITDRVRLRRAKQIIKKINHHKKHLTLEQIYKQYQDLEKKYEEYLNNK